MDRKTPSISTIQDSAATVHLDVFGLVSAQPTDPVPGDTKTIVLLGPREPGFWRYVSHQPEFQDGQQNALDRWSSRVIHEMAIDVGGTAAFPFGGPPYVPFINWALRSGRAWQSPVSLLVHDIAGLFVSYRGAIALPLDIKQSVTVDQPCETCQDKPCQAACPVGAVDGGKYDLDACHGFLDTARGRDCMQNGCSVRRACPVSQSYGRLSEQSAFHMKAFH